MKVYWLSSWKVSSGEIVSVVWDPQKVIDNAEDRKGRTPRGQASQENKRDADQRQEKHGTD